MACALIPLYFPTLGYDAIDTKLSLCALLSHGRHRSLPTAKSMEIFTFSRNSAWLWLTTLDQAFRKYFYIKRNSGFYSRSPRILGK